MNNSHVICNGELETQNPWYQEDKISIHSEGYIGVHTCTRFILNDGTSQPHTCNEIDISAALFQGSCLGDLYWQNEITNPNCNYRNNTDSFYQWQEWVR